MAASCVLVTNPSLSMPLLIPRSIDSSEGEGISGGFYCGENELILPPLLQLIILTATGGGVVFPGSGCTSTSPLPTTSFPCFLVLEMSSSQGLAVAVLWPFIRTECWCQHCRSLPPPPLLPHLPPPLPLSVTSAKDAPSLLPQGSTWWKNKGRETRGWWRREKREEVGEHLT